MLLISTSDNLIRHAGRIQLLDTHAEIWTSEGRLLRDARFTVSNALLVDAPVPYPWYPGGYIWDGAQAVATDTQVRRLIADAKARKFTQIQQDFSDAVAQIKTGYSGDEIASWDKQEAEARAYLVDPTQPTPLLSGMVVERGDTRTRLAQRIVDKADAWAAAYGRILGRKHARESTLEAIDLTADNALQRIQAV